MGEEQRIPNPMQANGQGSTAEAVGPAAEHRPPPIESQSAALPTAAPERKRGGANHVTHGMYASGLPKGAQRVARRVNQFRAALEAAVVSRAGEIDLHAAATINTACRWETVAQLAARWLRLNHEALNHDQRLTYASKIASASESRDKCLRALRLDKPIGQQFDPASLYDTPAWPEDAIDGDMAPQGESQATTPQNASKATVESEAAA